MPVFEGREVSITRYKQLHKQSADVRVRELAEAGFTKERQVERTNIKADPSKGGCHGYEVNERMKALKCVDEFGMKFASRVFDISEATLYRWKMLWSSCLHCTY